MNDLMNEFDPYERELASDEDRESWGSLLGGLLREAALASTDTLTRRLRRAEMDVAEGRSDEPQAIQAEAEMMKDTTENGVNELGAENADFKPVTATAVPVNGTQPAADGNPARSGDGSANLDADAELPKPKASTPRKARATRSGKRQTEENIAKRMFNWSAGTVLSNIADNTELDDLIDNQLRKRIPQLAHDPQVQELIRVQAGAYLAYLLQTPEQVDPLVRVLGDRYIGHLREHPEQVQQLIREQAGAYLETLGQDTAILEPLVQTVAGKYIAHMGEHPEQVQQLIQQEAGTYLTHLSQNPTQVEPLVQTIGNRYIAFLTAHPEPVQKLIQQEADHYVAQLQAQPERVEPLVQVIAGRYLKQLQEHPEDVEKLVQLLADRYLFFLRENPAEVNMLVQQVGDEYLSYLHQNPEQVQVLVQGQSIDMATEVMEEVRERTVTADSFIELLARSLLRRTPREKLPEPSTQVQFRAVYPRQPLELEASESGTPKPEGKP